MQAMVGMWRSVDPLLPYVGTGDLTQIISIGGKHLYPLCHLMGPKGKLSTGSGADM